jgi:precorrin-6A/cobalt-precorrin-6A reductase
VAPDLLAEPVAAAPILVLGGTSEGRDLADELDRQGIPVVSSLAGRVRAPDLPRGTVRVGGFGGADGFARWLERLRPAAVVDATHPFAERISATAAEVCGRAETPLLRIRRPVWSSHDGDRWHLVDDLDAAAELVPSLGERAFLTTGRRGLEAFAALERVWFLIRCLNPPDPPLPPRREVIVDRGPFGVEAERELMTAHRIDVLVSKASGGAATEAKLSAARELGLPAILVRRPPFPATPSVPDVRSALAWVDAIRANGRAGAGKPRRRPALLVAATHSGAGKTTATGVLLRGLQRRGLSVQPFKLGPDFVDAACHAEACGRPAVNLDLWMMGEAGVRESFARFSADVDVAVIEAMGALYDGADGSGEGSAAEIAKLLGVPVLIVLDVWGMTRTATAVLNGLLEFDPDLEIAGCILNRVGGPAHARMVTEAMPAALRPLVIGAIGRDPDLELPDRQLGPLKARERRVEADRREAAQLAAAEGLRFEHLVADVAP